MALAFIVLSWFFTTAIEVKPTKAIYLGSLPRKSNVPDLKFDNKNVLYVSGQGYKLPYDLNDSLKALTLE